MHEADDASMKSSQPAAIPEVTVAGGVETLLGPRRQQLARLLSSYIRQRRWFRSKTRSSADARIVDAIPLASSAGRSKPAFERQQTAGGDRAWLVLVEMSYVEGDAEIYTVGLAARAGRCEPATETIARLVAEDASPTGELIDVLATTRCAEPLLALFSRTIESEAGQLRGTALDGFAPAIEDAPTDALEPRLLGVEQSNTSVLLGERAMLKVFRAVEPGINPELEVGTFLTERARFSHVPPLLGSLEYASDAGQPPAAIAVLQGFVANQGDAWQLTIESLARFFERAQSAGPPPPADAARAALVARAAEPVTQLERRTIGPYIGLVQLLAQRTAQMHIALESDRDDPAFCPEPITQHHQQALYRSVQARLASTMGLLRARRDQLEPDDAQLAGELLAAQPRFDRLAHRLIGPPIDGYRLRGHGDLHLGQVLYTGEDFAIIDFEGEPARPLAERRHKWSPLRDVAGMLRSFDYAAFWALRLQGGHASPALERWAALWRDAVSACYLQSYLATADQGAFLPSSSAAIETLLELYLLDKALYELSYELNTRPDWASVPLRGLAELIDLRTAASRQGSQSDD